MRGLVRLGPIAARLERVSATPDFCASAALVGHVTRAHRLSFSLSLFLSSLLSPSFSLFLAPSFGSPRLDGNVLVAAGDAPMTRHFADGTQCCEGNRALLILHLGAEARESAATECRWQG